MKIFINGEPYQFTTKQDRTIAQALKEYLPEARQQYSFAVALNGEFVSKTQYEQMQLGAGDSLDVVFPIQGG